MNLRTIRRGGLKRLLLAGAVGLAALSVSALSAQPVKGGAITVATIGEPPTLDPMISTADLVSILTQHVFETLYTFDAKWNLTPLLAEKLPEISPDGLVYTIALRQGIKFHDGSDMDASDVLASLERWTAAASRGKMASRVIERMKAGIGLQAAQVTPRAIARETHHPLRVGFVLHAIADGKLHLVALAGVDHVLAFGRIHGHGLFAPHMLARRRRTQGELLVQVVGKDDIDHVDVGIVGDAIEIVVVVEVAVR